MPWHPRRFEKTGWKVYKYKDGCIVHYEKVTMEKIIFEFNEIISPKFKTKELNHIPALVRKFENILNGDGPFNKR